MYHKANNAIQEEMEIKYKMKSYFKLYPDIQKDQFFKYVMKWKESTQKFKQMVDKSNDLIAKSRIESNYKKIFFITILNVLPEMLHFNYEYNKLLYIIDYYLDKIKLSPEESKMLLAEIERMKILLKEPPGIMTVFSSNKK
jgi:hypothetical protein